MNIINVEMLDITDKQLICTSGNFVMGFKGDNNTTTVKFNVPEKFIQENAIAVLISPEKTQYSVPLHDMSFVVTSSISKVPGDWNIILMLLGNENNENMPVCVSDSVIGTIKDSGIDTDNLESLGEDENIRILYNDMLSLYNDLKETLLTTDIETVGEIQEQLNTIIVNMEKMVSIDWESIENISIVGESLNEIKKNIDTLLGDHETILNSIDDIDDKIGEDDNTIFERLKNIGDTVQSVHTILVENVTNSINQIKEKVVLNKDGIEEIDNKIVELQSVVGTKDTPETLTFYAYWTLNNADAANVNTETILNLIGTATDELALI